MFTDASGCQMKFDQRVGSNKWPRQVQFGGPHVHFLFHSDNSNTEWGYKFKVSFIRVGSNNWSCQVEFSGPSNNFVLIGAIGIQNEVKVQQYKA
jgi:hypothetical protein